LPPPHSPPQRGGDEVRGGGVHAASLGMTTPHAPLQQPTRAPELVAVRNTFRPARGESAAFTLYAPAGHAAARIYDRSGKIVRRVWSGAVAGDRLELFWDGMTDGGGIAVAGVYLFAAEGPGWNVREKIILQR